MKHLGDITKIRGCAAPMVDVVIGGSPCQDLSVAGKRAGLDGERSGLFMEQIRIIREMREKDASNGRADVDIRPRYTVWENVAGAFSSNKGEDFRIVLEELAKVADESAVIPRPADGKWTSCGCIVADGWSIAWRILDAQFWGVPQRRRRIALVADFGGRSAPEILFVRESVSGHIDESLAKRQGTTADVEGSIGADDCIGVDIYNTALTGDKACPLTTGFTTTGTCPKVMKPAAINGATVTSPLNKVNLQFGDPCHTLVNDGRNYLLQPVCYSVDQGGGKSACNVTEEQAPTLTCTHGGEPVVCYRYIVRRLTPLECERLQGYPDRWTDIGEWRDSNGKKRQTSDAARYKALGNSIALPPWKWVLKRLCACYERDATMASLFDGIGGFPYLWEQINGKGTCLWASEIEEFPMAVTKVRIGGD